MQKKLKITPLMIVAIITIIAAAIMLVCYFGLNAIDAQQRRALAEQQAEVETINQQRQEEYALALAEFQQQTTSGANLAWPPQKVEGWDVVNLDNYPLENATKTTVARSEAMVGGMLLVNEWHSRPDDYPESALVYIQNYLNHKVSVYDGNVQVLPAAADAMRNCIEDAGKQDYQHYTIWEAYRSWEYQNEMFQKRMEQFANDLSGDELIARTKKEVNYPGTSEFNTGLTMTVRLYKRNDSEVNNKVFFESDEGIWMYENSWKYGLVFRFPLADYPVKGTADKSYKTGVSAKLRAFRYVGKGNAAAMHTLDLCLEEYIEYLMEHPHIAVFENGALKYEIYREYVGDAENITVSLVGSSNVKSWSTSLDNMGYAVTVFAY